MPKARSNNYEGKGEYTGNQRALEPEIDHRFHPNPVGECNRLVGLTPPTHHNQTISTSIEIRTERIKGQEMNKLSIPEPVLREPGHMFVGGWVWWVRQKAGNEIAGHPLRL
jgi:hypothetical protein